MLKSPTGVFLPKGKIGLKPYRHIICNDMVRHRQYYEDVGKLKDRLQKTVPNIRQVMLKDMARMKTNEVYERILNRDLTGSRGLNLQYKQELQRLRSDELELKRSNRDLSKSTCLPSISQSPLFYRHHTPRLSSIAEENSSLPIIDKPESVRRQVLSVSPSRTSLNQIKPIPKKSSNNEHSHSLSKQSLQRVIAKTSDDHRFLQQHTHMINQQNRFIEQKLKEFLR